MLPFTIIQTGGRQKFLKKKKQKKIKTQTQLKTQKSILIVQKNVQRFIQYKRFYQNLYQQKNIESNKMEIEGESQMALEDVAGNDIYNNNLLKYWMLTNYHIREHNMLDSLLEYWEQEVFNKYQSYSQTSNSPLFKKIVKLTIDFVQQLFEFNLECAVKICQNLFKGFKQEFILINQCQLKQIFKFLNPTVIAGRNINQGWDVGILQKLWKQLVDIVLDKQQSYQQKIQKQEAMTHSNINPFSCSQLLIRYILIANKQSSFCLIKPSKPMNAKLQSYPSANIINLIIKFYPNILIKQSQTIKQQFNSYEYNKMQNCLHHNKQQEQKYLTALYSLNKQVLKYLYKINCMMVKNCQQIVQKNMESLMINQDLLIIVSFLYELIGKIKSLVIQKVEKKYNVNESMFQTEIDYEQYLLQKEEYIDFRSKLVLDYQSTKQLLKNLINIVLVEYKSQQSSKIQSSFISQQSIRYLLEMLNIYGQNLDIIPLKRSLEILLLKINQKIIYDIGKSQTFQQSSLRTCNKKKQLSLQYMLIVLLTLAYKSSNQTPDLYFIKYYQQPKQKQKLKRVIKQYLLKILKHCMFLPQITQTTKKIIKITVNLLENLYNKIFRTNILETEIFENQSFILKFKNYQLKKNQIKDQVEMFLTQFPYVFSLELRVMKLRDILKEQRYHYNYHGFYDDQDQNYNNNGHVKIRRNYQFLDAFSQMKKSNLRMPFRVTFINQLGFQQIGVDAGGLKKEFLNRVLKNVLNPEYGMFIQNTLHELLPHPLKAQLNQGIEIEYYQFIGKLIGLAIYENITLGYKFAGSFLNAIIGKKNTFDDLRLIDYDLYKSLIYIKDMKQDASQLCLTFMYKDETRNKHIKLISQGHLTQVTNQNKRTYIELLTNYKVNKTFQFQTRFIRKGLTSVIDKEWLFMFNYQQLNYIVSGQGDINIDQLIKYTRLTGYKYNDLTVKYYWEVIRQFTEEQKSKLLMFVTACPRPSFLGFKELNPPFTIMKANSKQGMLPVSHTCSNMLELPDYQDKQVLKKKLLTAIQSNSGFQFG